MGISEEMRIRSQRRAARYLRSFPPTETKIKVRERERGETHAKAFGIGILLLLTDAIIYSLD